MKVTVIHVRLYHTLFTIELEIDEMKILISIFPRDFSVKIPNSKKLGEKLREMCGGLQRVPVNPSIFQISYAKAVEILENIKKPLKKKWSEPLD